MDKQQKNNIPVKDWINQYKEQFERYNSYCDTNNWIYAEDVEEEYGVQKDISLIVLDRLKYFVKKFEPYLEFKYVKNFIDLMQIPVSLFLDRCNFYFENNDWLKETDKQKQIEEMKFQSDMMSDFNKLKDKLQEINLDEEFISLDLPIFGDKNIPFLMQDMMENRYPEIQKFREVYANNGLLDESGIPSLTPYDVLNSTEMFLNIKNPPIYDSSKHYFEQSQEVLDFYTEEYKKITQGVTIAGVFIHPLLYWYLNFFKTDIPMSQFKNTPLYNPSKKRLITNPFLRDNELFYVESYAEADEKNVGLFAFGTRRWGKTVMESAILSWSCTTVENSEALVIGGDEGDLQKLSKTLEIAFTNVHSAFYLPKNNNDWSKLIQFGLKNKAGERIPYGDIFIRNVNKGQEGSSEKTAGATPTAWIVDEAGKFNCKSMFQAAIPSFQTPDGWSLVPILSGTGGNVDLSIDAQNMLMNPEENSILPMNWDRLDNMVQDKDLITWKRKNFGLFLPSQMSFKDGLRKVDKSLSEYFNIDDERLQRINIKVTDWVNSNKVIKEDREKKKKDKTGLNKEKMYYPIDPNDCFLNKIENPFPALEAQLHKEYLIENGLTGRNVDIYRKQGTKLGWEFSDKDLPSFPFEGGNIDSPVILFEDPPEDNDIDGTYVSGLDHYKHNKASTNSLGANYIFKRNVNLDEWSDRVVACYYARPETIEKFNSINEMLIEGYGAECLQENADISFEQHLKAKHKLNLLANGEELARRLINPRASQNNKYGLNPNEKNQQYILNLVIDYCQEDIEIGEDEHGEKIIVKGVTKIPDIGLLDEIINFHYGGNFDKIVAFGHALAWARYLDSLNIMPKVKKKYTNDSTYKKQMRQDKLRAKSPYSYGNYKLYKK